MKRVLALFSVALLIITGWAPQSVRLENKYTSGETLRYKMKAISKGTITRSSLPGKKKTKSKDMDIYLETDSSQKVLAVDEEGTADLELSYDRLIEKITSANRTIEISIDKTTTIVRQNGKVIYDSRSSPAQEQFFPLFPFKDLIGQTMSMKMTKLGKTLKVKGFERLKEAMPQLDIQGMVSRGQPLLPEKEIRIGESWTQKTEFPLPQAGKPVTIETKYTLKGFEEVKGYKCAWIATTTALLLKDSASDKPSSQQGGLQEEAGGAIDNLSVKGKGTCYFAYKEGRFIRSEQNIDMSMEKITRLEREGKEKGMKRTKMDMKTKVVMELQ